jgi:hypothetical protein
MGTKMLSHCANLIKTAEPDLAGYSPEEANREMYKWRAGNFAISLPLLMAAAASIGRVGLGATNLFKKRDTLLVPPADDVDAPIVLSNRWRPRRKKRVKEAKAAPGTHADAALRMLYDTGRVLKTPLSIVSDWIFRNLSHTEPGTPMSMKEVLKGSTAGPAYGMMGDPKALGLGLPLAAASGYGAWKLTDSILDRRRKSQQEDDIQHAKEQYEAIAQRLLSRSERKTASADQLLDEMADTWPQIKTAGIGEAVYETPGTLIGALLSWAALSSLASGNIVYNQTLKNSDEASMREAMKRREKQQQAFRPSPVQLADDDVLV